MGIEPDLSTWRRFYGRTTGGAVAGREHIMAVMEQTGDAYHDRFERVYHGGTFNANPYCAATGVAALNIVRTGEMQLKADAMAERLRTGLRNIVDKYEVNACVTVNRLRFIYILGPNQLMIWMHVA
ncbi:MAG: hypothetical protein Ct9H300mP11_31260 [Chloroflexota bacterium]|nr:MAG: hypothetical protein Ct9H300mP11_31260 [Chloroflexota bacterium]